MRTSDLIIIQSPKSQNKFEFVPADSEIPIEHQNLVIERLKNSKEKDLLNWDDIKDDFDGI